MKKSIFAPTLLSLASLAFAFALAPGTRAAEKGATPAVISQGGAEIVLADNLVAGKVTVFDFFSQNCAPCMTLSPALDKLHAKRDGIAVVKIDIDRTAPGIKRPDLSSPVAQQFKLKSLPYFRIYGADGKLLSEGSLAMDTILIWLDTFGENPLKGFSRTW